MKIRNFLKIPIKVGTFKEKGKTVVVIGPVRNWNYFVNDSDLEPLQTFTAKKPKKVRKPKKNAEGYKPVEEIQEITI